MDEGNCFLNIEFVLLGIINNFSMKVGLFIVFFIIYFIIFVVNIGMIVLIKLDF